MCYGPRVSAAATKRPGLTCGVRRPRFGQRYIWWTLAGASAAFALAALGLDVARRVRSASHAASAASAAPTWYGVAREPDELPVDLVAEGATPSLPRDVLRVREPSTGARLVASVHAYPSAAQHTATRALDDQVATAWTGRAEAPRWQWGVDLSAPVHLALLRARFGEGTTSGIPTKYHWEIRPPRAAALGAAACARRAGEGPDDRYAALAGADGDGAPPGPMPTRASWFVDADVCALRLVVEMTNGGPPILDEVYAYEGARDVLRDATARGDGAAPPYDARGAIDGSYAARWAGAPGLGRWTLAVALAEATSIDRVRVILGFDAALRPRPPSPGTAKFARDYAIAYGPVKYSLEATEDLRDYFTIATTPTRPDGTVLPLRRRLITLPSPRTIRALRLVIDGATDADGVPDPKAMPIVREIAAYRSDDPRRVVAPPWILSVNANPQGLMKSARDDIANDSFFTKFIHQRFASLIPALRRDDRFAHAIGPEGEYVDVPLGDAAGEGIEAIEADDPSLDAELLSQSSPPPITVLSGSNDWDYATTTGPDATFPETWRWDPLRGPREGGMGALRHAVQERVAPFLGFCGGGQILALLAVKTKDETTRAEDGKTIDLVMRRATGKPIRELTPGRDMIVSWPGDERPRVAVAFDPSEPLFFDLAGRAGRRASRALSESHVDVMRPSAFLEGGVLERYEIVARSRLCAPNLVSAGPFERATPNPSGEGLCNEVTEAFRAKGDDAYPVIGTQFHPEQYEFDKPGEGDPPESVGDPRLFVAAAYEEIVSAYLARLARQ